MKLQRMSLSALALTTILGSGQALALSIVPNFIDNGSLGETWTASRKAVVNQAISDWESLLDTPSGAPAFDVDIVFTDIASSYLGQMAVGYSNVPNGTDLNPWGNEINRELRINSWYFDSPGVNLWFDTTLNDANGPSNSQYDALSVLRHEFGHMLGFASGFYVDDLGLGSQLDQWGSLVSGTGVFDPGGLNVNMASSGSAHVADSASNTLMRTGLFNGARRDIDLLDAQMLALAYGYDLVAVPEPATLGLLAIGGLSLAMRRRRSA